MKKIININLSGRVIPIEETAYDNLQKYLESLRKHFANEESRDEIINDIESRISELMNNKIVAGNACVTDENIVEIMNTMGKPEDLKDDLSDNNAQSEGGSFRASTNNKRFFRDTQDKFLGGVCSGIANYLNIDPVIVRFLFAIITLGGFGMGILIYVLLWILIPSAPLSGAKTKRLYRNSEDRILGGVCSGIAAYFDKNVKTVRLIFALPLIVNIGFSLLHSLFQFHSGDFFFPNIMFGSFTGTFILVYIFLWIILPEAITSFQKMEMRGETVDINTIKQNVKDGVEQMKTRLNEFGKEVKSSASDIKDKTSDFYYANRRSVGSGIGRAIGILIKAFFIFVGGTIAFALLVALLAILFGGGIGFLPLKNFLFDGFWQNTFALGAILLFILTPVVGFITWLIRRIMHVKSQNNYLGWTFAGLWLIGLFCLISLIGSVVHDFKNYSKVSTPVELQNSTLKKIIVTVPKEELEYSNSLLINNDNDIQGFDFNQDSLKISNVKLRVEKSLDSAYHVHVIKYAAGTDKALAKQRAEHINYNVEMQNDQLQLDNYFSVSVKDKYRVQRIIVEIQIPVGKKIEFDKSVNKLHPFEVRVGDYNGDYNRRKWDLDYNTDTYFEWETNAEYTMQPDGTLHLQDGKQVKNSSTTKTEVKYKPQPVKYKSETLHLPNLESFRHPSILVLTKMFNG